MKMSDKMCEDLFTIYPVEEKRWVLTILQELHRARAKHPLWPTHNVIRAAIIGEETGELIRAALKYEFEKGKYCHMHREAVQVGAMALRFLLEAGELPQTKAIDETTN